MTGSAWCHVTSIPITTIHVPVKFRGINYTARIIIDFKWVLIWDTSTQNCDVSEEIVGLIVSPRAKGGLFVLGLFQVNKF